jgi:hypothetical protein
VHEFASVTTTVYVPEASPVAIRVVCPPVHEYECPIGSAVAVPMFAMQLEGVEVALATSMGKWVITPVEGLQASAVQILLSSILIAG